MGKRKTNLQLLIDASGEDLPRTKADDLQTDIRDLITALENVADDLDAYANAERDEISDTRETLASTAGDTLSELHVFGFDQ